MVPLLPQRKLQKLGVYQQTQILVFCVQIAVGSTDGGFPPHPAHFRAFGALREQEAWGPSGPTGSDLGWGWGAAQRTQCVEVYTMAQLLGGADSSIWPLPPASVPAGTEGAP